MVEGAVYVLLHPCKDSYGFRMQLCERNCLDECDLCSCVMHVGHLEKMEDSHKNM